MARRYLLIPERRRGGWFAGWLRGFFTLLIAAVVLAYLFGVPHVLTTFKYRHTISGPVYLSCNYLGPFGWITAKPGDRIPEDCPIVTLIQWEHAVRMGRQTGWL